MVPFVSSQYRNNAKIVSKGVKIFLFFNNPKLYKGTQEALSVNRLPKIDEDNPKITTLTPLSPFFYPHKKAEAPLRKAKTPLRKAEHPLRKAEDTSRKAEIPHRKAGHLSSSAEYPPSSAEALIFVAFWPVVVD